MMHGKREEYGVELMLRFKTERDRDHFMEGYLDGGGDQATGSLVKRWTLGWMEMETFDDE